MPPWAKLSDRRPDCGDCLNIYWLTASSQLNEGKKSKERKERQEEETKGGMEKKKVGRRGEGHLKEKWTHLQYINTHIHADHMEIITHYLPILLWKKNLNIKVCTKAHEKVMKLSLYPLSLFLRYSSQLAFLPHRFLEFCSSTKLTI